MTQQLIDAHLHLFNLAQGNYHWLKEKNPPFWPDKNIINQSFNEQDLKLTPSFELGGFIHIEAGFDNKQPWREISWLESHCKIPFRSVAAVDLTLDKDAFIQQVDQLLSYKSVVGCRHILDEQAAEILQSNDISNNLNYLASKQLSFDLQMPLTDKKSVDLLVKLLTSIPVLTIMINHAGWPPYQSDFKGKAWLDWQDAINTLSQFKQCAIKCSGWEMIDRNYSDDFIARVISSCIDAFGDNRVMLASNFPLNLFHQSYENLWQTYSAMKLTSNQLTALTRANAAYWYRLTL
jgi:predicted TIM-barrel fold metal-dependent hydrolase